MFNGVPAEQLRQLIAASSRTSVPFPISFSNSSSSSSLHHQGNTKFFPSFDPFITTTSSQQVLQQPHHHLLQQQQLNEENSNSCSLVGMNLEFQKDPVWSRDELLALLRTRSSLQHWFPELTWEHVSRRLEELGDKRSAEKCKEKFEEETRNFNDINYNRNYKTIFSEFDDEQELYHGQKNPHDDKVAEQNKEMDQQPREEEEEEEDKTMDQNVEEDPRNRDQMVINKSSFDQDKEKGNKKRKLREKNFEKFKGFCEDNVNKLMAQLEEMHNKLLEDMVKRDEEKVAKEEAWKKQEADRINKELEIRACEQAIACDRQATIIKFLTNFSSSSSSSSEESGVKHKVTNISTINIPPTSSSLILAQNPNPTTQNLAPQNPSSNLSPTIIPKMPTSSAIAPLPQNPNSPITQTKPLAPTSTPIQNTSQKLITSNVKDNNDDIGKRWQRDEVLALINLRYNLYNINGDQHDKEGAISAWTIPMWERISQGMLELGYKRSAKRCKEKWENINKYFRKTKDTNKKRSLDSRTCPYFHQLSTLYNQGILVTAPCDSPENHDSIMHVTEDEKNWFRCQQLSI